MWLFIHVIKFVYVGKGAPGIHFAYNFSLVNQIWYTVECRYNAVAYIMILHKTLQWIEQSIHQTLNPQKTPHISPWRASYEMSVMRICEKIGRVITAPHCRSAFMFFLLLLCYPCQTFHPCPDSKTVVPCAKCCRYHLIKICITWKTLSKYDPAPHKSHKVITYSFKKFNTRCVNVTMIQFCLKCDLILRIF